MSADARAKALSALARSQVTETAVGDTRHRISETTLEAIRPAVVAGVTMLGADGHPTTVVYTDPLSPEIDEAQYREGIGTCLDAWREKRSSASATWTRRETTTRGSRRPACPTGC